MPTLEIDITGNFTPEELNKAMFVLGELVLNKVKENIRDMRLIVTGDLLQGWFSTWKSNLTGGILTIDNRMEYAQYIEYGTYDYGSQFGDEFPSVMDPKKKDLSREIASLLPKGGQPFAPVRRVLYNSTLMNNLIQQSFNYI